MQFPNLRSLALLATAGSFVLTPALAAPEATFWDQANIGAQVLINQYWDASKGLFGGLWWNSAVALTHLADLHAYQPNTVTPHVPDMFATVLQAAGGNNFLNGYYDDEGWWALAWIAAYDLTKKQVYLDTAVSIWQDMKGGWFNGTGSCGGGIWWDKAHTGLGNIENELFISVSAHLANRVPASNKAEYVYWAEQTWKWFAGSGLLNPKGGIVADGYDVKTCKVTGGQLTYSQGVIIGALLELNGAAPKSEYLSNATAIADAVLASGSRFLDSHGVLTEPVGGWSNDTMQFKGIFMRNLNLLQRHAPKQSYVNFAAWNGNIVWSNRWANGQFGPTWDLANSGQAPYSSSQSSGLAALTAAGAMNMSITTPNPITKRLPRSHGRSGAA